MYYAPIYRIDKFISDPVIQHSITKVYNSELMNLHFGQNWDIHWHNGKIMPTEEQYLQMVINKTSVLPRLCLSMISIIVGLEP
jgi:geranylgeranyl diphosphate synthase, type III